MNDDIEHASMEELRAKLRRAMGHRRQWDTRHEAMRNAGSLYCICANPSPSNDGMWLKLAGTVQCEQCGRAIFDADGNPVKS